LRGWKVKRGFCNQNLHLESLVHWTLAVDLNDLFRIIPASQKKGAFAPFLLNQVKGFCDYATFLLLSTSLGSLRTSLIVIFRGFIVSGISRTRLILSKPLDRSACTTFT